MCVKIIELLGVVKRSLLIKRIHFSTKMVKNKEVAANFLLNAIAFDILLWRSVFVDDRSISSDNKLVVKLN